MKEKKETGGLEPDIIQPGDQTLDANNLINTVQGEPGIEGNLLNSLTNLQYIGNSALAPRDTKLQRGQYDEFDRLIDGPFSLLDENVDDRRAAGQGVLEKVWNSYGVKLAPKIGTHVVGSTVGLVNGLAEVGLDMYNNGPSSSNWNKFFNNDFQRSLDDFNKALDEKFPAYYTSQERDLGFWQSVFGKGAANFWTDQASQGLSFVAGAVLAEFATAGVATAVLPAKAVQTLKRISALRNTAYAQKSTAALNALNKISRADRIYDGLTTGRRLLTGAFYEAGVEARHNYDSVVKGLTEEFISREERPPSNEELAKIKHVATQVSNGVFAGNVALVGYSNILLFNRIFGSGMKANKSFKGKIMKDDKGVYKAKHQDWGGFRTWTHRNIYGSGAWGRYAAYEGMVEEGGQKTLDLAGQYAASDLYTASKTPGQIEAVGGIMNNIFDGMADAYGSTEGQKEIFLGFILAAIGLPSFIKTNEKGEREYGFYYGRTGGFKDYLTQYRENQKEVDDLVKFMNENPDAIKSIKENFEMLNDISSAEDKRDYADASNNDFAYKNADHDAFFAFVFSRIKGGYYGDVADSINDIRNMDDDTFETMFGYGEKTQNMSEKERKEFLNERKNKVADSHIERAEKIKEIYDKLDNTKLDPRGKKIIAQALSSTADLDAREQKLIEELEEQGGFTLKATVNKEVEDQEANENILQRVANFTMEKLGLKAKDAMENSEVGKEVKKEVGIKEFTTPGAPAFVAHRMMEKLKALKKQRQIYEENDQVDEYIEITETIESLEDELAELIKGINEGTAPNLSEEEKQVLEEYRQKDPAGYELNKDEMIKKLQDLRRIRAKRHQMLNLVQQMIDPAAAKDTIQQFEEIVNDILTEEERKSLPPEEQRLARKYKGKIVEFDYTDKNGNTRKHRVFVKDTTAQGLVKIPQEDTYKLLQRQKDLNNKAIKTEDDLAELELIAEELKQGNHVTSLDHFNFGILSKASNIKVMTEQELLLNQLQAVTGVLQEGLAEKLAAATEDISRSKEKLVEITKEIKEIKQAIQKAKTDTRGRTYVNLNRIGRRGGFSVSTAQALISELIVEEQAYKQLLKDFTEGVNILQENSLQIQAIHTALTDPDTVADFLNRAVTQDEIYNFINDILGLTSLEEFNKQLGESGFFNLNELTEIIGQKNKEGGYDVDNQLLEDFLKLAGQDNISKEYLDLMSSDLANFREELDLLTQHRKDVQRMLNKMIDPITGEVSMFPPDGLTEEDLVYLQNELRLVDQDVKTLQGIINMMEAEIEQNARDALNSDLVQQRIRAINIQSDIFNAINEYNQWLNQTQLDPAEEADLETGETITTLEDLSDLSSYEDRYSPSFTDVGWTKTAGNHSAALDRWRNVYKPLVESGKELTRAEQLELQHIMSQLRFFRQSYDITNYSKNKGARLQIVTRYNIRPEWKDKIVFFDIAQAEKTGRYDDESNFKYADDITENPDRNEAFEDIKLLLVDANGQPILVDGEFAYTNMNSSSATNSRGEFKGDERVDLDANGNLTEPVRIAQESFVNERNKILGDNQERFFYITGKSQGLPIPQGSAPGEVKSSVMGRLKINKGGRYIVLNKEEDLKDLRLEMALPAEGVKGADQKVTLFNDRFRVTSRFVYFGTESKGYNGTNNLVPGLISRLSENQVNNIYNLSRYFAENGQEGGINLGGKGFTTILKDQIMYGSRSQERARQEFAIYMKDDTIYFGENGSITLDELKDAEQFEDKHTAYKNFLRTLYFNVNSTMLNQDKQSRKDAVDKGKAAKRFVAPEYVPFNEVLVRDDLSVDIVEYDNYTHYLTSDRNREPEDIPVRVDMPLGFNPSKSVNQAEFPQFMNIYLKHGSESFTKDSGDNQRTDSEQTNPDQIGESPFTQSTEFEETTTLRYVDPQTGEIKTVKVAKANISEEEKERIESDVSKAQGPTLEEQSGGAFSDVSNEDPDDVFFLESMEQPAPFDLNQELEWFDANMPKDKNGNPLVGIDLIRGLIDGKGLGKFTKDGNILLSDLLTTPGIVYHESWHAITRKFMSPAERTQLYDEVRGMRGSTKTFKGDTKKMSELSDKEADEWLAEEFREYVLADGNYKVGSRVKKSLIDRIFDKIYAALKFFVNSPSQIETLMSRINSGYFSNPTTDITIYDVKEGAYYEGSKLTATMRNNVMEGMTVLLFNKALRSNQFTLDDFVGGNPITEQMYGGFGIPNTVYTEIERTLRKAIQLNPQAEEKLTNTMLAIKNNWQELKEDHKKYLERFKVEVVDEQNENDRVREQFGKPQNEIDPSVYLPKAVRLLFATLPKSRLLNPRDPNSKRAMDMNEHGLPKLVDFGSIMNYMYKEMGNTDPLDFMKNLERLKAKRPELQSVYNRLGLHEDMSDRTSNQMKLIIQTMMQFDQSNNTFYTQLMTRDNGRMLVNSNQNRIEDKVKFMWASNFKNNIQNYKGLGKDVNGELILNEKAKVKVGNKEKTFKGWGTTRKTADEALQVLDRLGITFTDSELFSALYNEEFSGVSEAVNFILQEVYNKPVSDLFKGNIQRNLRTLVDVEAKTNPTTVDLQHRNPEGKTVHGVNLKTYADVLVSKLNGSRGVGNIANLLKHDNLRNSYYLNRMLDAGEKMSVVVLEGVEQQFGRGKPLSRTGPVDIGVMYVNSVLNHGIVPLLRTADKKTEFGIQFGSPQLSLTIDEMLVRMQGYLADELRVASKFNSRRNSKLKQIDKLKDTGGNLRFFAGIVPSLPRKEYTKKLSEQRITELIQRPDIVNDLRTYLTNEVANTRSALDKYNIAPEGIDSSLLSLATQRALDTGSRPVDIIAEQFTYEYMTGVIEQSKLLLGDFALYGQDLFKRTSGISGTKVYPTSDLNILDWMNTNRPNLLSNREHSQTLRVSNRGAVEVEAPYLDQYIDTLTALGAPLDFQDVVRRTYSDMEEFDGGGFITLDAYRSLMYRTGKWTDAQEDFYQKVVEGETIAPEDMAIIPPIKPQLFGPQVIDGSRLMTFHKYALFPIIPGLLPGTNFEAINNDMINNDIDYMIFESAVKVGGVTLGVEGYDPFYEPSMDFNAYKPMSTNEQGEVVGLQELAFSDLGIQVETAPKTKQETSEGSQLRSLLPINIYDNGNVAEEYSELENVIDDYHAINNALVNKDLNSLLNKLKLVKDESGMYKLKSNDLEEFKKVLIEEFKKRDNPVHTVSSIEALLDSDTKFIEQLFEKNKIENLLFSLVNNNVLKRKMPGGQFVLQAATGFENNLKALKQDDFDRAKDLGIDLDDVKLKPLKFYRKEDPNNPNSKTLAMQVYLPSRFEGIVDVNDSNLDSELLQLIGFRIPTEGPNSMDFIEVAGFLPKSFGDTVIVPSEIVGKAGSDYDIDKLNIYFPNSTRVGGKLQSVQFDPNKSIEAQSKKALQNELQRIIKKVLEHPASFDQLISPVGAYKIKDLAKDVAMRRNPEQFDVEGNRIKKPLSQMFSLESMINTSHRLFSGLGGIGIVATSSTQHAKGQRPGLNWNFADHEDIKFNFEGLEPFSLSRVRDVNNGNKISSIIGEYVTGYVDVTKEDFIFDINAGIDYAPLHMLLIRSGVPVDQVIYFMSQPIIDEYIQQKNLNSPLYASFPLKTDTQIVSELTKRYGGQASSANLNAELLRGMVGRGDSLSPLERQVQVQVLNDFKRYQSLAEDLLLLKDATSVDTSLLNNGMAIRYLVQSINTLEQEGRFTNLDELLYGNEEGASTVAGFTKVLMESDGLFADFKLSEYITDAKEFIDNKLFENVDKNVRVKSEDIIYKMKKFENFLATSVVQSTPWDYSKLHERAESLFLGENSLPRRINNLKRTGLYQNNLLIQELTPILQVYTQESNESTVDGLKLFSKKLQPYDVDLLADAFMELKEVNPKLAEDLMVFSVLQSGYEFNPNSFFQVIPGTEALAFLSKYFKTNKKDDRTSNILYKGNMENLWQDFHRNYYNDNKVVPNIYRSKLKLSKETGNPFVVLNRSDQYISVTSPQGIETIGNREVTTYSTLLFKANKLLENGKTLYIADSIKGVKNNLIEATGETSTIVNRNIVYTSENIASEPEIVNTVLNLKTNTGREINDVIEDKKCK